MIAAKTGRSYLREENVGYAVAEQIPVAEARVSSIDVDNRVRK